MTSRGARNGARSALLGLAALALGAATIPLAGSAARAFTMESLSAPNSDGSRFGDSDDQVRRGGTQLGGPGGPVVQFGSSTQSIGAPFGPRAGFAPTPRPPEPYAMPNND
jgi:hypothetical protein